jgi:hypothetical protein
VGKERCVLAAELKPQRRIVLLLGREVPVLPASDGALRADDGGKPASAKSVETYIVRAFGDRLTEVRVTHGGVGRLAVAN